MRGRAGISAGHSPLSWTAKRLGQKQAIEVEPTVPAPSVRVHHPAIEPRHRDRWYRVIRLYRDRDHGLCVEDIGEFPVMTQALIFSTQEQGRARVLAPFLGGNGKQVSDNGQPIEVRS